MNRLCLALCAAGLAAGAVTAAQASGAPPSHAPWKTVEITDGIAGWRLDRDGSLLLKAQDGGAYRATFFGSCPQVAKAASIGFRNSGRNVIDRFSVVTFDGLKCYFRDLQPVPAAVFGS